MNKSSAYNLSDLTYSTYVRDKSIEWENLQRLPSIDGSQDIATGWQTKMVAIDATSSTEISVMPPLYSVNIENGYVANRQLYVQYAPNSTFASIQHFPVAAAMYQASSLFEGFLPRPGLVENQPGTVISSIKMPQPVVSVLCNMNSITDENDTRPIQFPNTYIAGCGGLWRGVDECSYYMPPPLNTGWATTNYTGISRNQIWNQAKDFGEGRIIWVDDIPVQGPTGLALGAIVVQPQVCGTATNKTFLTTSACVIAGVWANATTTAQMDSSSSFSAQSSFDPTTFGNLSEWSRPPVKLSKAWAESLNPLTGMENRTVADNLLRWMPVTKNLCPLNGDFEIATEDGSYPENTDDYRFADTRPFMHEALLASLVANGMSYAADNASRYRYWNPDGEGGWMYTNLTTRQDAFLSNPPGIVLTFHGHLPGYAMTLDGIPIKIAIPILLLYCIYTIAYLAYTFISGRSSRVWSTMSGFTALAINSTPTEVLKHTSAGIKHTETFRNMVSVREVENHDRLELVFDQDVRALKKVMVGRGY
jgi:hypothetical protein